MLAELIPVEEKHFAFWQKFFGIRTDALDLGRRVKLRLLAALCRFFGPTAVHLVMEAIEIYGVRKYLALWEEYKNQPLGAAVRAILEDEFQHEEAIVSQARERRINPERIRNIFLGFNDGLVEILGALSGFFAAFRQPKMVLMAGSSVAVAGALSMAAGAYVAASSEHEMQRIERGRAQFLGASPVSSRGDGGPLLSALIVGMSYFLGAMMPVLPVLFGAGTIFVSILISGFMFILVSLVLAFLSGMDVQKRILLNIIIMTGAVAITYFIGSLAKSVWGIAL